MNGSCAGSLTLVTKTLPEHLSMSLADPFSLSVSSLLFFRISEISQPRGFRWKRSRLLESMGIFLLVGHGWGSWPDLWEWWSNQPVDRLDWELDMRPLLSSLWPAWGITQSGDTWTAKRADLVSRHAGRPVPRGWATEAGSQRPWAWNEAVVSLALPSGRDH